MYALLFFLPIYYRVIKTRSPMATALLLLPQTAMMIPCAGLVLALANVFRVPYQWIMLAGWACTTCGIGLLALLDAS